MDGIDRTMVTVIGTAGTALACSLSVATAVARPADRTAAATGIGWAVFAAVVAVACWLMLAVDYQSRHNARLSATAATASLRNLAIAAVAVAAVIWIWRH